MSIPVRYISATISLDITRLGKTQACQDLAQKLAVVMLCRTTKASMKHKIQWAQRAYPTGFARVLRNEMRELSHDLRAMTFREFLS